MEIINRYFDDFTEKQIDQFDRLMPLYKEWNDKINVVSRKDIDNLYLHHVLHSLSIAAFMEFQDGMEVLDIGCGGGFPGIPLAIFFPTVKFHLVDSIGKKLKVVEEIGSSLGLTNVTVRKARVEEIKGAKFHFAISRGVASLKELWGWASPLLRKGNNCREANGLICLKGGDLHLEISESCTSPKMMEVFELFPEEFFKEKYLLHVPK